MRKVRVGSAGNTGREAAGGDQTTRRSTGEKREQKGPPDKSDGVYPRVALKTRVLKEQAGVLYLRKGCTY